MANSFPESQLNDKLLPPGLSFSPGEGVQSSPEPQPVLDDKVLPPGLSFKPSAAPDPGMTAPAPSAKEPARPPESEPKPDEEVPGFWQSMSSAFHRGLAERTAADVTAGRLMLPPGVGGETLQEAMPKLPSETKDYVDKLRGQNLFEGFSNPKWWMVQGANAAGSLGPGLAAAGAGTLVGGPIGGVVGFGLEAAMGNFMPAYQAAVNDKSPNPVRRAIVDSGIAAAFAAGMGMAGKIPIAAPLASKIANETIAGLLERPVAEAFAQLGVVGPGLAAGQDITTDLSHGDLPNWPQVATDAVLGGVTGLGVHEFWKTGERLGFGGGEEQAPAGEEAIRAAFETQATRPGFKERVNRGTEPAAPVQQIAPDQEVPDDGHFYQRDLEVQRPTGRSGFGGTEPNAFYSKLNDVVETMPEKMQAKDVYNYLKGKGVKDAELQDTFIPSYLADKSGQVKKSDLQAWIDSNRVQVLERVLRDPAEDPMQKANDLYDHYSQVFGSKNQSQWSPRAQRHMTQVYERARAEAAEAAKNAPQYRQMALPGMRGNPEEALFMTPISHYDPKLVEDRAQIEAVGAGHVWSKISPDMQEAYRDIARKGLAQDDPNVFTGSHHEDPNVFAHARYNLIRDRDGKRTMVINEVQSDAHQRGAKEGYRSEGGQIPDLPFKGNWHDFVIKRLIQMAANRGVDRLVLYNGDQVGTRLNDPKELAGARANYDKKLPGALEKWSKMYGSETGETNFPDRPEDIYTAMRPGTFRDELQQAHAAMGLNMERVQGPLRYVSIDPKMAENLYTHGHALYDRDVEPGKIRPAKGTGTLSDYIQTNEVPAHLIPDLKKMGQAMNSLANHMGVTRGIEFVQELDPNAKHRGFLYDGVNPATGNYKINVNLHRLLTRNDLYASLTHEVGHVIFEDKFKGERPEVKAPVFAAFEAFRDAQNQDDKLVGDVRRERDNAISLMTKGRAGQDHYRLSDLVPRSRRYFLSFDEWGAEQVAKWMQTDERPLGIVDKFFKRLGNVIRKMVVKFRELRDGGKADPEAAVRDYLNGLFDSPYRGTVEGIKQQFDHDTTVRAQEAFDREGAPETKAVPMEGSTAGGRNIISGLPPEARGPGGESMPAHADRMNWFYKMFTSLPQVQQLNPHIKQLGMYLGMHRTANVDKNTIMGAAMNRITQWSRITDQKQLFGLTNFIQEYAHMDLRPTDPAAFRDLAKKHELSEQSLKLFNDMVGDFDGFLERYRTLLVNDALAIKDPARRANNMQNINTKFDDMLRKPFMPITHFGKYSVTIYDSGGNIRHYEQTNTLRRRAQIVKALESHPDRLPGDKIVPGMVPKDVAPFMGMPPGMIDLIGDKLNLSTTQRASLDQLRFDYAPAQTFKHQFRNLDLVPGYSTDFQRAYAHFFFHGANHLTRVTWIDQMRDQIRSLGSQSERIARAGNPRGADKLDMIVKYMQGHLDAWADPKSDWAALRGLMFHFYLGMNPASAVTNLTQTALSTYPWLASKYGDVAAIRALSKSSLDLNNFYKKGTLLDRAAGAPPGPEGAWARAAGELVKQGTLSETQAHQLAAISEDRNMLRPFGKKAEKAWLKFQDMSGWMFDASEQYNRRVAAKAAWDIAMRVGPDHKAVKEAIAQDPILYKQLTDTVAKGGKNWTAQEAASLIAAKHAVEKTQFEYQPYAKPAFMRGKLGGNVFIFKQFTQNMMFNLASNPGMLARWLVVMGAMGGVGGIIGYDNANQVIKTVAQRVFGKDFDLDDEVRHFAHDVLNDEIGPDTLLHGLSVKGFGIPHVMHSMGANWFPTVDMSRSVGMGDVLGFDPMALMGLEPSKNPKENELRQLERASGATFAIPFSLFDFANSSQNYDDLKKYEPLMPHWLGAMSHAYRWYTQGREVNAAGNTIVRFNPADTEHMSEILMRSMGFQPRRYTEETERIMALKDSEAFWDLRKQVLMRQFGDTVKNNDTESKERVTEAIRQYNNQLPPEARAKAITSKALKESVQQRMRVARKQEAGVPLEKSSIPLQQSLEPYYPRGWPRDQVGAKPVQ